MGIPEGKLYNDQIRDAGEIVAHHPAEYIFSMIAEGVVPFGAAVVQGTTGRQATIPSAGNDVMLGVAGKSIEASDFDNEKYSDGDPLGVVETGIVAVRVEEAVRRGDAVRIRHGQDVSAGYQEWGFAVADKTGASASGLDNDVTKFGAIVTIDGVAKEVSISGQVAQTLATVIAEINADIGLAGVAALVDGKIRITSATHGAKSSVSITDGNDSAAKGLFATLTDAAAAPDAAVPGLDNVDSNLEPGNFCVTAVAGKTAVVSGAQWASETAGAGVAALYVKGPFNLTADV